MENQHLTCFGSGFLNTAARLYFIDVHGHVNELARGNRWVHTDLTVASRATAGVPLSPLVCFGEGGTAARLYYLDNIGHVNEIRQDAFGWAHHDITAAANANPASASSALACFGVGGTATRLYYLDLQGHVIELGEDNGWVHTDMTVTAHAAPAAPGSALACFGVGGFVTRLYYLDAQGHVNELGWDNNTWINHDITAQAHSGPAAPGSALACFGVGGTSTRLYYLDALGHVHELRSDHGWFDGDITAIAAANAGISVTSARPGSALTCFGFAGTDTRLYFIDRQHHVHELAWYQNKWIDTDITAASAIHGEPAAPIAAASGTSLTCFGFEQTASRVYYMNLDGYSVNELSWQNRWVNRVLWITQPPAKPSAAPALGLQSNSNYIFNNPAAGINGCQNIIGLIVTADVTTELAGDKGFGFQVNASSPTNASPSAGQQYLIFHDPTQLIPQLFCQVNNYTTAVNPNNTQVSQQLINRIIPLALLPRHALPVGYRLTIALHFDLNGSGNVVGATYVAVNDQGVTIGVQSIWLNTLQLYTGGPVQPIDMSPIVAFQLNVVAYQNNLNTVLSSGVGIISYAASTQLSAVAVAPACVAIANYQTRERSNCTYGSLPEGPGNLFTQSFQTG